MPVFQHQQIKRLKRYSYRLIYIFVFNIALSPISKIRCSKFCECVNDCCLTNKNNKTKNKKNPTKTRNSEITKTTYFNVPFESGEHKLNMMFFILCFRMWNIAVSATVMILQLMLCLLCCGWIDCACPVNVVFINSLWLLRKIISNNVI